MEFAIAVLVGLLVGGFLVYFWSGGKPVGTLRVDTSIPDEGPYLFLELSKDVGHIGRKKYIVLKVNTNSYIPHK